MRDYLDNINKSRRKRERIYLDNEFAPEEEEAPKNAPFWTKTGYNGSLKKFVDRYARPAVTDTDNMKKFVDHYARPVVTDTENIDEVVEDNDGNDNNNQEKRDEPEKSDDEPDKSDERNKSKFSN